MAYDSDPRFRVLHALRIKGFAKVDVLADLAAVDPTRSSGAWPSSQTEELALFRETRALWQLTPAGREVHADQLAVGRRAHPALHRTALPGLSPA